MKVKATHTIAVKAWGRENTKTVMVGQNTYETREVEEKAEVSNTNTFDLKAEENVHS